ncbi:transducin beta-like protein 2 [Limulus polyphemus]|uniref:Transducin beta-like protein 2 n=1 Tax=Limulus polyphemus TaxID=6850 RepID=A0ABM1B929_LIMPO|nr:transducin beta-like protein 2 [Limulus polyphemus]
MAGLIEVLSENTQIVLVTSVIACVILLIVYFLNYSDQGDATQNSKDLDSNIEQKESRGSQNKKKKGTSEKRRDAKTHYTHPWLVCTLKGHSGNILDMDFSSNGKYLASCAEDRAVLLWSVKTFTQKEHKSIRANVEFDHATRVKWSPDSKAFIICQGLGNTIQVYKVGKKDDGSPGNIEPILTFPQHHTKDIINIGISCNGRFIMTCSSDTLMVIWDLKGEVLTSIDTHHVNNYWGCVSPCGRFVASSGFTPDVKVWEVIFSKAGDFKEVKRAFELKGHSAGVYSFAFSNDSSRMASVSKDQTWRLWDTNIEYQKGQEPYLLLKGEFASLSPSIIALSPDGRTVAIASSKSVSVFSRATGEESERLEEVHSGPIKALQFSQSGKYLLVAGEKHIRVFHNIQGYKNTVHELEEKKKHANNQTFKERLQSQIDEAKSALKAIEKMEE